VNLPASVAGSERARLFCGLRLPDRALDTLSDWQADHIGQGRPVARDHLHITLAFLGHRPARELDPILGALREAAASAERPELAVRGYRETRSVGMLTCDDDDGRAAALADDLQERLVALGVYEHERRGWLPHVTVVRFRERPRLQPAPPALKPFVPSDAAAYLSRLRPGGAQYEVLESVEVGGR
jgi:RNA 2',3'-cyclic 3'-phosphodiesterase